MYRIERDPLMRDASAHTLAQRIARVITTLQRHQDARCAGCGRPLCGHEGLMSMVLGYEDGPMCLSCLARAVGRERDILAEEIRGYVLGKECLRAGWAWVNIREEQGGACALAGFSGNPPASRPPVRPESEVPVPDAEWDAGTMGCGELTLELRARLASMKPGQVLKVTALDPGAPEDLPAWCRLTGHALAAARPPEYWIRRKEA